ncbi:MAG: NAD-dependent epimerase/dehydratase family protein [Rubrobacteraceae bacterium]
MSEDKLRVLVSGGAGFIGSHVAERLVSGGHEVAVVDDLSNGRRENVPAGARFYEADIRGGCAEAFRDFRPEALCHQAAQVSVRRSVEKPSLDADVNLVGTVRLLQNCVEYGVRKVVFASTGGAIYGEQESFPAREEHPQRPVSPYGLSKLAAERYLDYYRAHHNLPGVVLRYANVYGPRQDPHGEAGVVAIFCNDLALGNTSTINGTGEQTRDYVYVEDVVQANILAITDDSPSGTYNVGTGTETSVNELHRLLRETSGIDLPARLGPAKAGEQARSSVDPTRAGRHLGWRPQTGLADGLRKTLRYSGVV